MILNYKTQLNSLNRTQLRKITKLSLDWCFINIKPTVYKTSPEFRISKKESDCYGEYLRFEENKKHFITLYPNECKILARFISTIIHEYIHSTQKLLERDYDSYNFKYGSWENPFEVESRNLEKEYRKQLLEYILNIIR
jgi:hypothetical protein